MASLPPTQFVPGHLCTIFEHPKGSRPEKNILNHRLFNEHPNFKSPRALRRSFHFERKDGTSFTMAFFNTDESHDALYRLTDILQEAKSQDAKSGSILNGATLNWHLGAADGPATVGGPGAWPVAPKGLGGVDLSTLASQVPTPTGNKAPVNVVILDTAPTHRALKKAYDVLNDNDPGHLFCGLYNKLEVFHAGDLGVSLPNEARLISHDYRMPDHGLFVAGIIHQIYPDANLFLLQVLSDYGIGTLEGLAQALYSIAYPVAHPLNPLAVNNPFAGAENLIINCSLNARLPRASVAGAGNSPLAAAHGDFQALKVSGMATQTLDNCVPPIEEIFKWLGQLKANIEVPILAAAGNDGIAGSERPISRYPASLANVIGVGALDASHAPAVYSNLADVPTAEGLITFGGSIDPTKTRELVDGVEYTTSDTEGMRGVYIGAFPDGTPNETGYGMWAGTSFSTPVITGLVAKLIASQPNASVADLKQALVTGNQTPQGENVVG